MTPALLKRRVRTIYHCLMSMLFLFSCFFSYGQDTTAIESKDFFNVKLRIEKDGHRILLDTHVTLDYLLCDKDWYPGISNFDRFEGFNYPLLTSKESRKKVTFYNDSIELKIEEKSFDKKRFKRNISTDSNYYTKHPYYGTDEHIGYAMNLLLREISSIELKINGMYNVLSADVYENFFNPSLERAKVYLTDRQEIILVMDNGIGAGGYFVIIVFDSKGLMKRKIVQRVL